MTRAEAKALLVKSGVAEPTEEQITNLLDSVTAETKKEKDRADKLKEKADKAGELEKQLAELQNQNLSEAEKTKKENEALQAQIAELRTGSFKAEARAILKGTGLDDADIEALLPSMVAGIDKVEDVQARANAYVGTISKVRENAVKEHDKDVLNNTKTPGGNTSPNETKTEAEKVAENIGKTLSGSDKGSADIISAYTK